MKLRHPQSILITGASSGIGAALARAYAAPGRRLILGGRNEGRLSQVADDVRRSGADVEPRLLDVAEPAAMADWLNGAFDAGPVDLVIANAGISGGTDASAGSRAQVDRIFAVNIGGVVNTVFPALDRMRNQPADGDGRGQIAIMSSLAGFRGLPGAPAYAASKACVRSLGEGLRGLAAQDDVRVSVICPGFVKSAMTDVNPYPMPFLMSAERAARIIRRALSRDRARISFPWRLWAAVWLMTALPVGLTDPLFRRMPAKPPLDT